MSFRVISQDFDKDLAYTNFVYQSPEEAKHKFVSINGITYKAVPDKRVSSSCIALNSFQRSHCNVKSGDLVSVTAADHTVIPSISKITFNLEGVTRQVTTIHEDDLTQMIENNLDEFVFNVGQTLVLQYDSCKLKVTCTAIKLVDESLGQKSVRGVFYSDLSIIKYKLVPNQFLQFERNESQSSANAVFRSFNFTDLGIGGLDKEFSNIFRRAFASRTFPPNEVKALGLQHVKGILLYGPPGFVCTGKTLIARRIGEVMNGHPPKIVNGPEILDRYVGASEQKIRDLFQDAVNEWKKSGPKSKLHVIIFDEMDAVCRSRGSGGHAGVGDSIVNQLLSIMDGVDQPNNFLVIGMTNRKDMIDEALLRPGRIEVHVEINLPNEQGRFDILNIHTKIMRESNKMSDDVDLQVVAKETKNYSGAELAGVIRTASANALYSSLDDNDINTIINTERNMVQHEDVQVKMEHIMAALEDVKPLFGSSEQDLKNVSTYKFLLFNQQVQSTYIHCLHRVQQIHESTRLFTMLLYGEPGTGKTTLASQLAMKSGVAFVRVISAMNLIGKTDYEKAAYIHKTFLDAYKCVKSFIIIDDIERIIEYFELGCRYSTIVLQTLLSCIHEIPPNGKQLIVVCTSNHFGLLTQFNILSLFDSMNEMYEVSSVEDIHSILQLSEFESKQDVMEITYPMGIKKAMALLHMD